jgi:hypothetical protein
VTAMGTASCSSAPRTSCGSSSEARRTTDPGCHRGWEAPGWHAGRRTTRRRQMRHDAGQQAGAASASTEGTRSGSARRSRP